MDSDPVDRFGKTRRWERFKVNVRAHIMLVRKAQKIEFSGMAHDISSGGMALFLPNDLIVGESIRITFSLPYSKTLTVDGVVRNRRSFEYGVEFANPSREVQADLERNCRALALLDAEKAPEW